MRMVEAESLGILASYFLGTFCPAIWKKKDDTGYGIRILKSSSRFMNGNRSTSWDYYDLDNVGVIITCPRGLTKQFKGCRVRNIDAKVEEYKDKQC
jgi:hypothetical protein